MKVNYRDHAELVDIWFKQVSSELSSEQLAQLLEQTLTLLVKRARLSVSAVMLTAILDRVIFNSAERHPLLETLKVSETGIDFDAFYKSARSLERTEVAASFQVMITNFLAILGTITNQVITPELHAELSKIKFEPKLKVLPRANGDEK